MDRLVADTSRSSSHHETYSERSRPYLPDACARYTKEPRNILFYFFTRRKALAVGGGGDDGCNGAVAAAEVVNRRWLCSRRQYWRADEMREWEWAAQGKAATDALRELAEVRCRVLRAYSA